MYGPDDLMLGGSVATELLVVSTPTAALALREFVAYPTGFLFLVTVRFHPSTLTEALPPKYEDDQRSLSASGGLRLAVHYSDGTTAAVGGGSSSGRAAIWDYGWEGTEQGEDRRFWISPLPPAGTIVFALAWPSLGVDQGEAHLSGELFHEAAARARPFWPDLSLVKAAPCHPQNLQRRGQVFIVEDEDYDEEGVTYTGRFSGYWEVEEGDSVEILEEFHHLPDTEATAWGRARAPVVLIRPGDRDYLSAGEQRGGPQDSQSWPSEGLHLQPRRPTWWQG